MLSITAVVLSVSQVYQSYRMSAIVKSEPLAYQDYDSPVMHMLYWF